MPNLHPRPPNHRPPRREKWYSCNICGPVLKQIHCVFTSGGTEPTVGETLTCGSSTGVVVETLLATGAWGDGDATGNVTLSDGTGVSDIDNRSWGTADAQVDGSTGGSNMMTLTKAWEYTNGIMYPKSMITERDGVFYCEEHYYAKFTPQDEDEVTMDLSDVESDIRSEGY